MHSSLEAPEWPPRSPYEALLSSPHGRRKLEQRRNRISPSPPNPRNSRREISTDGSRDEDEEDEETLELRLQALQAKLKLKKLQNRKAKAVALSSDAETPAGERPNSRTMSVLPSEPEQPQIRRIQKSKTTPMDVQVPLSPERRKVPTQEQMSPGRILLGIDKGLSGKNVSLRRAPSLRDVAAVDDDPFARPMNSAAPMRSSTRSRTSTGDGHLSASIPKSFNERIAECRAKERAEQERKARSDKQRRQRSTGFSLEAKELEGFQAASLAEEEQGRCPRAPVAKERGFTREQVMRAAHRSDRTLTHTNSTVSTISSSVTRISSTSTVPSADEDTRPRSSALGQTSSSLHRSNRPRASPDPEQASDAKPNVDPTAFEAYSSVHLSRRVLPHTFLERNLEGKTALTIPGLLRDVKRPDFSLPESVGDADYVVFGIVASKSSPLNHKDSHRARDDKSSESTCFTQAAESEANVRRKYMVLTLTDLKWTLDLYLFTTAYTRFRKLAPGTLVAILNPGIMPPPPGRIDTGRWSLTLNSSDDTVLEIGTARDIAWCKAIKKDGQPCSAWLDGRRAEFCEFHLDRNIERCRRGRMEVQGMSAPFAPGGRRGGRTGFFGGPRKGAKRGREDQGEGPLLKEGMQYDRSAHSSYYIAPNLGGRSAASLFDADEEGGARGSKEERMRRALAEKEREREIARKLGVGGNGTGAEYLRSQHGGPRELNQGSSSAQEGTKSEAPDAGKLGLLGNKAGTVQLSPLKRKASTRDGGGARKKTRFVTEKGIREAGRESLSTLLKDAVEDDDDLDIV